MTKNSTLAFAFALAASVSVALSGAAFAQAATRIKQNNAWGSYSHQGNNGKICYILSMPTEKNPSDRDHGDVFFMLAQHPGQNVTLEPQFKVGYAFEDNSKVVLDIDGKKFNMFTRGQNAWMENPAEDTLVVDAMKAGREMSLSAVSRRGTQTRYVYSLSGVTASLDDIGQCQ
ncbi:MAG: invasion associated locus B family protein [Pseudomonadota bacterium]|nr:invasion associated locus B family protein [Pseudomonadota bacterium]